MAKKAPTAQVEVIPTPTADAADEVEQAEEVAPTPERGPNLADKLRAISVAPPSPEAVAVAVDKAIEACHNAAANALTGVDVKVDPRCAVRVANVLEQHGLHVVRGGSTLSLSWGEAK